MPTRPALTPLAVVRLALPALLLVGVLSFAGPCPPHEDGQLSPCVATSHVIAVCAVAALAATTARLLAPRAARALDLSAAALGLAVAVLPGTTLPLCAMATMRCHILMRPFALVSGLAIAALALADAVRTRRFAPVR